MPHRSVNGRRMPDAVAVVLTLLLAAVMFVAPARAMEPFGLTNWQWDSPQPQGNTLNAVAFAGKTGYAAGNYGTLLKSTDAGASWHQLPVDTFGNKLTVVEAPDARTVVAAAGEDACVMRRSTDGGKTFAAISLPEGSVSACPVLDAISSVSRSLTYVLFEDGVVQALTGNSKRLMRRGRLPGMPSHHATSITFAFANANTGIAETETFGDHRPDRFQLYRTTDGGRTWHLVNRLGKSVDKVAFIDARHVYAVGTHGLVLRSDNGGKTWARKDLGLGKLEYLDIACTAPRSCVLASFDDHQHTAFVHMRDGGDTRGTIVAPPTADEVNALASASSKRVVAVGDHGAIAISDDAGAKFRALGSHVAGSFSAIRAGVQAGTAVALGKAGALARTSDGGRTWHSAPVPTSADLRDAALPTASTAYVLDDRNALWRTTDGGAHWGALASVQAEAKSTVAAGSAGTVLLFGPAGVRRSADGGVTFQAVQSPALAGVASEGWRVAFAHGDEILASSSTKLVRSTDDGGTWQALHLPGDLPRSAAISTTAFCSRAEGFLVENDQLWRTTDAGLHWQRLSSAGFGSYSALAVDAACDVTAIDDSYEGDQQLLRSSDHGATWHPELIDPDDGAATDYGDEGDLQEGEPGRPVAFASIAASGKTTYLLTGAGGLLHTTSRPRGHHTTLTLTTSHHRLRARHHVRITIHGRLRPAHGGEHVTIISTASRDPLDVVVKANGSFTLRQGLGQGTTTFVAQWPGDARLAGSGSRALTVTVRR